ncbi:response regulator transcription factor [Paenibacillus sp. N4]|uniref:response regulator transcription factor n=1 Tax=Paenibacillus vietnamensis TaxID=2590547 RepID=UPI001CD10618|nr:response regulator transcription factor [Paenibacillus vietnamensis]MCA0756028.1 response regulator transcription factor [Paenibacillus vietnamensis]
MFKVVIVDDELYARQGLKQFTDWNKYGFEIVAEAANGEEALQVIERTSPDLVVTDIRMPVLDGLELIRTVQERKKAEPKFIIVSGYGDFKYAQKAVRFGVKDFILKPIDECELEQTLSSLRETLGLQLQLNAERTLSLRKAFMEGAVRGAPEQRPTSEMLQAMGITEGEELMFFEAELCDLPPAAEGDTGEGWKRALAEALASAAGQAEVFVQETSRNVFGFVAGAQSWKAEAFGWKTFAAGLQQQLRSELGAAVILYGGIPVRTAELISESCRSAAEARERKFAAGGEGPVLAGEWQQAPLHELGLGDGELEKLMLAIEESEPAALPGAAEDLFKRFRAERYSQAAVIRSLGRVVLGLIRIIECMNGDKTGLRQLEELNAKLQAPATERTLKAAFAAFLEESARYIGELRKSNAKGSIQRIKQYIEEHYDRNLSLKSIAGVFYMNPVYLGQLFRKTYGVYFNEFLLQTRMHEAKRLLRQTELRVYEIADKVGFSNPDYFVTQFEKVERKTPSEYRSALYSKE